MRLTKSNYYSQEMNQKYWSASFVKSMLNCPASALAELRGEYERPKTSALMVGSYVDEALTGNLDKFKAEHPEILKKDGTLKADYVLAEEMIARAKSDETFMRFMKGRHQSIKTGTIDGIPFKAKFDIYVPGERIVDLKTVKDTQPVYKQGMGKVNFADAWNWVLQMAIYQHLEGHGLPCYLAVITKESPCDIALIQIEQYRMDAELQFLRSILPKLDAMRSGIIEPDRCDSCAYCRATRKLNAPIGLDFYDGGNVE